MVSIPDSSFEEARCTLRTLFTCPHPSFVEQRPQIVEVRTKKITKEITYKELLEDLYISALEDQEEKYSSYSSQVKQFEDWYVTLKPGEDKEIIEELLFYEKGQFGGRARKRAADLRDKYFFRVEKIPIEIIPTGKIRGRPKKRSKLYKVSRNQGT